MSKRLSVSYNPYSCPEPDEEINDRSIDFGSERGNLMGQSFNLDQDNIERHEQNDITDFTLHDEIGMLNLDKAQYDDNDIFESRNSCYSFDGDVEMEETSPEAPYPDLEEHKIDALRKGSTRNNSYSLTQQSSPENEEISEKDLRILQLQK